MREFKGKKAPVTCAQIIFIHKMKLGGDKKSQWESQIEDWYKYTLLDMWLLGNTFSKISRDTEIPRHQIRTTILKTYSELQSINLNIRDETADMAKMWIDHFSKWKRTKQVHSIDIEDGLITITWLTKNDSYHTMVFKDGNGETLVSTNPKHN